MQAIANCNRHIIRALQADHGFEGFLLLTSAIAVVAGHSLLEQGFNPYPCVYSNNYRK